MSEELLNELSEIYRKFIIKVNPEHGGNNEDMVALNEAYSTFKAIITKYSDNEKSSFDFPYPNYPFRTEDVVCVNLDDVERTGKIISIGFLPNGKYEFVVKFNDKDVQKFQRDTLDCSIDKNFYLFSARWED